MQSIERIQNGETVLLSVVIYLDFGYYQTSSNINLTSQFGYRRYRRVLSATRSPVRDLRFSQWFCWRSKCSGLWRLTVRLVVPEILKQSNASIFRVRLRGPEVGGTIILRNFGKYSPTTQSHVSEGFEAQSCSCVSP